MTSSGKKLINSPDDVVTELIEGLARTYPGLRYLDGFPEVKVVVRADVSSKSFDKVAIISGGGSGHEPAHAGFVGEGMLTAAICGDVFASPHVEAILAGIRAVTGPKGCLLIVKNYTGDRLNFGLAAEQAKAEGLLVEMVIVGDDCALPPPRGIAGRRGLAGTLFVHKVAGAAATAGLSLSEVTAEAKCASEMIGTMGVALSVCTLPGQSPSDRLGAGKMELGLGIHGEPGAAVADLQPVNSVVSHVVKKILSPETNYLPIKQGNRVVVMINGLGGTPTMELLIVAGNTANVLEVDHGITVERVYTGSFMTSLDMAGFSITVMKVDPSVLQRLDAPTKAPAWPVGINCCCSTPKVPVPMPPASLENIDELRGRPRELNQQGVVLEAAIEAAAKAVIQIKDQLNEWDGKAGDADCGSTLSKGAAAILEDLKTRYPLNDAVETVNEVGNSIRRSIGGTSGIIYNIFCKAAYAKLKMSMGSIPTPKEWAIALEAAISAVSTYGGAKAGYRTMLDALIPASEVLKEKLDVGVDPPTAFLLSAEAASTGAESTKHMQAQAGRASYVSGENLSTVPDPGAMAVAAWYRAAATAIQEKCRPS
ncbi:hypothetical protein MLD38_021760 [Melastoma candidum]|nr:hypothetical protein MLD38_021760 [Melastoma candidum]